MKLKFEQLDRKNNPVKRDSYTDWFNKLSHEQKEHIKQVTGGIVNILNTHGMIERIGMNQLPLITVSPVDCLASSPKGLEITIHHYGLFDQDDCETQQPVINDLRRFTPHDFIRVSICNMA
jgi:hypothetical protein